MKVKRLIANCTPMYQFHLMNRLKNVMDFFGFVHIYFSILRHLNDSN